MFSLQICHHGFISLMEVGGAGENRGWANSSVYFKIFVHFSFGCAGSSLLHGFSPVVERRGSSRVVVCGLPLQRLLLLYACSCCGAQAVGCSGFSSCGSQALEHRQELWFTSLIAPRHVGSSCIRQGLNPCLLHLQADSLPLAHQGSPLYTAF